MADIQKLVEELSKLTVLEAVELSKALEETWGVSAAAAVAVAAGPVAAAAEEKSEFANALMSECSTALKSIREEIDSLDEVINTIVEKGNLFVESYSGEFTCNTHIKTNGTHPKHCSHRGRCELNPVCRPIDCILRQCCKNILSNLINYCLSFFFCHLVFLLISEV